MVRCQQEPRQSHKRRGVRCGYSHSIASHRILLEQELGLAGHRSHSSSQHAFYLNRHVHCLTSSSLTPAAQAVDKAFCSAWLDNDHVLVGTKCNTLLCLHIPSRTHTVVAHPPQPVHRQGPDLLTGPRHNCGQHAIAVSPDGCFVATGGQHTQDITLWQIRHGPGHPRQASTILWPAQTLMGHVDWVFGLAWTSNQHFVSAGRDKTIKLWQVPQAAESGDCRTCQDSIDYSAAVLSVKFHKDKVRDIKYDLQHQQIAAACVDGTLSWWSPDLLLRGSYWLPTQYEEPLTVQSYGSLLVVGCKNQALFIDTRVGQRVAAAVAVPNSSGHKRRRVMSVAVVGGPLSQPSQHTTQQGSHEQQPESHGECDGIAQRQSHLQQPSPWGTRQQTDHQHDVFSQLQHNQEEQHHAEYITDDDSTGFDSEDDDYSDQADELDDITQASGNIPVSAPLRTLWTHQLPAVSYAYERVLHQHQQRLAAAHWQQGQQHQGVKRLLYDSIGAAVLPAGVVAADVQLEAELTGEMRTGESWGVRSLSLQRHLLSIGTGEGDIIFHDLRRMSDYPNARARGTVESASSLGLVQLEHPLNGFAAPPVGSDVVADPDPAWQEESWGQLPARVQKLSLPDALSVQPDAQLVQAGLLDPTAWADGGMPSAVYTHCWDSSGMRLFVGGGPLQMGYKGCSLALFAA